MANFFQTPFSKPAGSPPTTPTPTAPAASSPQVATPPTPSTKMSADDFANKIKAQYPQYQNIDNQTLAKQIIAKYPQYSYQVDASTFTGDSGTGSPPAPNIINKIGSAIGNFGMGVLKGAASTIAGGESLIQKGAASFVNPTVGAITGIPITKSQPTLNQQFGAAIAPQGTAQKAGLGTEQVGEFFIPGGAEEQAVKATEEAAKAAELGKGLTTAAKLGAGALTTAGIMGGISSIQEGSLKDFKTQASIGGVLSLLSEPVAKLIDKIPETAWSSILKRTPTVVVKDPNLEAEAAKTGLMGISRQSILDKAGAEIGNIEQGIDALVKNATGDIPTSKIMEYVMPLRDAYKRIPGEESSVKAINDVLQSLIDKQGETTTVQEAQQLKKDIYQHIAKSYGKGLMEISPDTEAQKQIARGLKTELETLIPGIHDLNQQHAVYNGIQEAIDRTMARGTGKGIAGTGVGLYDLLAAGIGEIAGGPLVALGAAGAKQAIESPAVLSGVSKAITYFNSLSPTAKMMFATGLKGLISEMTRTASSPSSSPSGAPVNPSQSPISPTPTQ